MSISEISCQGPCQNDAESRGGQRQYMGDLASALKSNDITGAREAFSNIQKLQDQSGGRGGALANGFRALGDALQAGDLAGAKSAFSKMGRDFQTAMASQAGLYSRFEAFPGQTTSADRNASQTQNPDRTNIPIGIDIVA